MLISYTYTLYTYSNIREFKNVGGMDTVGIVYNTDIYTRLTTELTSKLGHIRTQQLLSTISDIHYEDCLHQWWSSPATPYSTNTISTSSNISSNTNTSTSNKSSNTTNNTSSNYNNTSSNSYINTSSYISGFDNQQEQQARIHEFISFIRYCTNNTLTTTYNAATTTSTDNNTDDTNTNTATNSNITYNTNSNTNYTNNTPIIIGHSLFFKLFYSTRLSELLKHTRPELYNMLYNNQYKLTNCSVLVLSILFSHDNDNECIILDAEVLYGGGFELNGGGGIGGMGGGGGGRKRQERLSITSVGSRSRLSGGSERSSGGGESGGGAGGVSSSRGSWTVAEGGVAGESQNATTTADKMSSKKGSGGGGVGGLWDSLWG